VIDMNDSYIGNIDTSDWKKISMEYLEEFITLKVPPTCDILQMKPTPSLKEVGKEIEYAFENPVHSKTIEEIISSHFKAADEITVAIAVSDNTRPVPYCCDQEENILSPILTRLEKAGVKKERVKIIIGCGTHTPTSQQWKRRSFGDEVSQTYYLIDHDCYADNLIPIGKVKSVPVGINKDFMEADIHIVTGLVEAHFMAGASGGRKAVCPGMINIEAIQVFHGPEFMADKNADNLVFDKNPCHEFALEVARKVRVDFTVNVLLNGDNQICGIYTGELEQSHQKAVEQLKHFSVAYIGKKYDIVLTHGGKGAVNHYQAVKGVWGAAPALKKGGQIILLAHNQDNEPIGSQYYQDLMQKMIEVGLGNFYPLICSSDWTFTHDQWEVQKWEQVFLKIGGFHQLIYCTANILPKVLQTLPGISGYEFNNAAPKDIGLMVQNAIFDCFSKKRNPSMVFIKEGPYVVIKKHV